MTEPFLPRRHRNDTPDAADPGLGAPGTDDDTLDDAELDAQITRFEDRLDSDREQPTTFRTPTPPRERE